MEKSIIDVLEEAIGEYLSEEIVKYGNRHSSYVETTQKINEIKGRFCRVGNIFDFDCPEAISKEECKTLIECLMLKHKIDSKELEIAYVLGFRDCIAFGSKFDLVTELKQEDVK